MNKNSILILFMLAIANFANAQDVFLSFEGWDNEDRKIWESEIIPVFEKENQGIKVKFVVTDPMEYDTVISQKLAKGTAGELITCRPFNSSFALNKDRRLVHINDQEIENMRNFGEFARLGWWTDDKEVLFCVPIGSVIHGFIYNKEAFDELGLKAPVTEDDFFNVLKKIKEDGSYIPMAMGTKDKWEAASMGYQNIGPSYWKGETGRKELVEGKQQPFSGDWVTPYKILYEWREYLGEGYEARTYQDSLNLFIVGQAAIYPAGSWVISGFNKLAKFEMGAFPPPIPNDSTECYISDHAYIGIGMKSGIKDEEKIKAAKTFLNWVGSEQFAPLYSNALPGFFSLSDHRLTLDDPLANEFVSWRDKCERTIRSTYRILSRDEEDNLEIDTWNAVADVMRGDPVKVAMEKLAERTTTHPQLASNRTQFVNKLPPPMVPVSTH